MASCRPKDAPLTCESYLRKLPPGLQDQLAQRLNVFNTWETLAAKIPADFKAIFSDGQAEFEPRFSTYSIESFKLDRSGSPAKALLRNWGMDNCRIKHLIKLLLDMGETEAVSLICSSCCPSAAQEKGNSACCHSGKVEEKISVDSEGQSENITDVPTQVEKLQKQEEIEVPVAQPIVNESGERLQGFTYQMLSKITGGFDTRPVNESGHLLGSGGFADVFLGSYINSFSSDVKPVAVKRLKVNDSAHRQQFDTEVEMLLTYKHENIVTLLGSNQEGMLLCIVFEYVANGSLEDRLGSIPNCTPLDVRLRLGIATGTARAIDFLHDKRIVHRDVKSANILLDSNFIPKLCDFATARIVPLNDSDKRKEDDVSSMSKHTNVIIGTRHYLAPEAYYKLVQPSLDVFSFGIVLLEILTGLPPLDDTRTLADLKSHVEEFCFNDDENEINNPSAHPILELVDRRQGIVWNDSMVEGWYQLANRCLKMDFKERDSIKCVLKKLNNMFDDVYDSSLQEG